MSVLWQDATRATAVRVVDAEPEPALEVFTAGEDWQRVELPPGAGGLLARALGSVPPLTLEDLPMIKAELVASPGQT
jgi:hypothetical protein